MAALADEGVEAAADAALAARPARRAAGRRWRRLRCFKDGLDRGAGRGLAARRRCWSMRGRACASSISAPAPAARPWRWPRPMENKGQIVACDVLQGRRRARGRRGCSRAGVHNVERRGLCERARSLGEAPCRRLRPRAGRCALQRHRHLAAQPRCQVAPDARRPRRAASICSARILDSAARLVKPGGRLVYATCSLLPEENEAQVDVVPRRRIRISRCCRSPKSGATRWPHAGRRRPVRPAASISAPDAGAARHRRLLRRRARAQAAPKSRRRDASPEAPCRRRAHDHAIRIRRARPEMPAASPRVHVETLARGLCRHPARPA